MTDPKQLEPTAELKAIEGTKPSYDISKAVPFVAPILIIFGVTRLILYYSYFNISILNFLDFSEILTSFLDSVVVYVFIIAFLFSTILPYTKEPEYRNELKEKKEFGQRFFYFFSKTLIISFVVGIFLTSAFMWFLDGFDSAINLFVTTFSTLILAFFYIDISLHGRVPDLFRQHMIAIYLLLLAFIQVGFSAKKEFRMVTKKKASNGVVIEFASNKIVSDSSTYYIGNTRNYVFIYDERKNQTMVYPMSDVKQIVVPRGAEMSK